MKCKNLGYGNYSALLISKECNLGGGTQSVNLRERWHQLELNTWSGDPDIRPCLVGVPT